MDPPDQNASRYESPDVRLVTARRSYRRWGVRVGIAAAGMVGGGLFCLVYFCLGIGQRERAVEHVGPIQVVANEDRAWVFLEIERSVREPGLIAGSARRHTIAQVVIEFDENGVARRTELPPGTGLTFHENLGTLFGLDDGIYLLQHHPFQVLRWDGKGFVHSASPERFSKLPELAGVARYHEEAVLDRASQRHGWALLVRESHSFHRPSFTWNGGSYVLNVATGSSPASVRLSRTDAGRAWSSDVASLDQRERPARRGE